MEDILDVSLQILPNATSFVKKMSSREEILFKDLFALYERFNVSKQSKRNANSM